MRSPAVLLAVRPSIDAPLAPSRWRAAAHPDLVPTVEPIVHLATGATVAREVAVRPRSLVPSPRWRRAGGPRWHAELTAAALELAAAELARGEGCVHVDATAGDLESGAFVPLVLGSVPVHHRGRLVVEITEDLPIGDRDAAAAAIAQLRGSGVRFAVDGFGEGWSNFSTARVVRPELLKVTTAVLGPRHQPDLAPVIVSFARAIGATTVIERVDDEATARWAQRVGFDLGQGRRWAAADHGIGRAGRPVRRPEPALAGSDLAGPSRHHDAPSAGFEPAHTAPEADALSPELRGRGPQP